MVVGGARFDCASPDCPGLGCAAATGCGFCGADAGCWATAVIVTASRAKIIQFIFIWFITFRITLISKVVNTPVEIPRAQLLSNPSPARFARPA